MISKKLEATCKGIWRLVLLQVPPNIDCFINLVKNCTFLTFWAKKAWRRGFSKLSFSVCCRRKYVKWSISKISWKGTALILKKFARNFEVALIGVNHSNELFVTLSLNAYLRIWVSTVSVFTVQAFWKRSSLNEIYLPLPLFLKVLIVKFFWSQILFHWFAITAYLNRDIR